MKPFIQKSLHSVAVVAALATIAATSSTAIAGPRVLPIPISPILPNINPTASLTCPDPAVVSLRVVSAVPHPDANHLRINVRAVLKNKGNGAWHSHRRQQFMGLVQTGRQPVRPIDFVDLAPGETRAVTKIFDWQRGSEFRVGFTAYISYDPDIYIDANAANNDCNRSDNRRTLSVAQTDTQITALLGHRVLLPAPTLRLNLLPRLRLGD